MIIKFDMYRLLKKGDNLFFISKYVSTDGTCFEEIITQDGRSITTKVISFILIQVLSIYTVQIK